MTKMYRLQFHKSPCRVLYIFKMVNGLIVSDSYVWTDITGDANALTLKHDEVNENGIYTPIIKTSLEVSLIRRNTIDFYDIIEAEDNEYVALVLEGEKTFQGLGPLFWDASKKPYIYPSTTCLFKGALTLETYGEAYKKLANVRLIFHDRIGELADINFDPKKSLMTLTSIFGEVLNTITTSTYLYLEYPFKINLALWKNLKTPSGILLDITKYNHQPKLDLLIDILESHGLQLSVDFLTVKTSFYGLESVVWFDDIGIISIELCVDKHKPHTVFWIGLLVKTTVGGIDSYTYAIGGDGNPASIVKERNTIRLDTSDCYIKETSGQWSLARKAKYIEATNNFELKGNIIFPDELLIEDFINCADPEYNLQYRYWFFSANTMFATLAACFIDTRANTKAYANSVGYANKLGCLIRDDRAINAVYLVTSPCLVIKDGSTFSIEVEVFSTETTINCWVNLVIKYNGILYCLASYTDDWQKITVGLSFGRQLVSSGASLEYITGTITSLPQPPFILDGESYEVLVMMATGNTPPAPNSGLATYCTNLKLSLSSSSTIPAPRKLTETTDIITTRRKPIIIESKFYNLPAIPGNTSIYASGILATGLDGPIGESGYSENSENIIAPATLLFRGNNATLLTHLSDMIGINHVFSRWKFTASVLPQNITSPSNPPIPDLNTIEGVVSTITIDNVGGEDIIGWENVTSYGMWYKNMVTGDCKTLTYNSRLYEDHFFMDISSLSDGTTYQYAAFIKINGQIFYGEIITGKTIEIPSEKTFIVGMEWMQANHMEETSGFSGTMKLRNVTTDEVVDQVVLEQYSKSATFALVGTSISTEAGFYIDMRDATFFINGTDVGVKYLYWSVSGSSEWWENFITDAFTVNTDIHVHLYTVETEP